MGRAGQTMCVREVSRYEERRRDEEYTKGEETFRGGKGIRKEDYLRIGRAFWVR